MAQKNYLIAGLAGTGKSSICLELIRRGYDAIDTDDKFGYFEGITTQLGKDFKAPDGEWKWHEEKLKAVLQDTHSKILYLCGGATNQLSFKKYFTAWFELYIDDVTMIERITQRTNNMYGKHPDDLAQQLTWNKTARDHAVQSGAAAIDATRPLNEIVDEIIQLSTS